MKKKITSLQLIVFKNEHARNHTYAGHVHQPDEEQAQIYH